MLPLLSIIAGALIAIQAGINSQLGVILKNSLLATVIAFMVSALISLIGLLAISKNLPTNEVIRSVPLHFWFGGAISAFGVGLFYFLIPKMGVGSMMSLALTGQLITAVLISHFGWFGLPESTLSLSKCLGVFAMISGILLINR
ncbi:MAG: DMT family transporter [Kangiellaceae bacterium]|jgi:bacterial/archaeal transporter family-2 protein